MVTKDILLKAYALMCKARAMANIYEENRACTLKKEELKPKRPNKLAKPGTALYCSIHCKACAW